MKTKLHFILLMGLLIAGGCSSPKTADQQRYLVMENKSSRDLHEVVIKMDQHLAGFGLMTKGASKVMGGYPLPFGDEAEVSWSSGGVDHSESVMMNENVRKAKAGVLVFTVYDDRVLGHFEAAPKPAK
jgi:hypothetical protein